ncbi:MAG: ectoine synthase [Candidatus Binatia bacterium]
MIVRSLDEIVDTERDVRAPTFHSRRLLLRSDRMGFSLHDTILHAGSVTKMWYRNHVEAVYCIEGEGELEDLETGCRHAITPGTMYALDGHERHVLRAITELRMVCVFDPPLTGKEVHDADGVYPLIDDEPSSTSAGELSSSVADRRE